MNLKKSDVELVTQNASELMLFQSDGERFPCCFCPEVIDEGQKYMLVAMIVTKPRSVGITTAAMAKAKNVRRAHWDCCTRVLKSVLEIRDKNGKSEDLEKAKV